MSKVTRTSFAILLLSTGASCVAGDEELDDSAEQAVEGVCSEANRLACEKRVSIINVRSQCRFALTPNPRTTPNTGTLSVLFTGGLDCTVNATLRVKGLRVGRLGWQINGYSGDRATTLAYSGAFNGQQFVSKNENVGKNANIARGGQPSIGLNFCRGPRNSWVDYPITFRIALPGANAAAGATIDSLDLRAAAMTECP